MENTVLYETDDDSENKDPMRQNKNHRIGLHVKMSLTYQKNRIWIEQMEATCSITKTLKNQIIATVWPYGWNITEYGPKEYWSSNRLEEGKEEHGQ